MTVHLLSIYQVAVECLVSARQRVKDCAPLIVCCLFVGCTHAAIGREMQPGSFSSLLSRDDIREIKALVAARPDIKQPVWQIATDENRADHATVYTGRWLKVGDESDYFQVQKHRGRWKITSPISHDRLKRVITVS